MDSNKPITTAVIACPRCGGAMFATATDPTGGITAARCGQCGMEFGAAPPRRSNSALLIGLAVGLLLTLMLTAVALAGAIMYLRRPMPAPPALAANPTPAQAAPIAPVPPSAPDPIESTSSSPPPAAVAPPSTSSPSTSLPPAPSNAAKPTTPAPATSKKPPALRYAWKDGQRYRYKFDLEAKFANRTQTSHGYSGYTVAKAKASAVPSAAPQSGTGTAVVVDNQGHLLTCAHVVDGAKTIEVLINGTTLTGKVLGSDADLDVAVIKIEPAGLQPITLADSTKVQLGQEVRSVGFPLANVLGESVKVNRGTVSGMVQRDGRSLIQIDAPINPGNSGGPIVDVRGRVLGIASAKLDGAAISNVGFCVPAADALAWLKENLPAVAAAVATGDDTPELSGPDLAQRVIPSVALVKVVFGADGPGNGTRYVLKGDGFVSSMSMPNGIGGGYLDFDTGMPEMNEAEVLASDKGQLLDVQQGPTLPFLMGSVTALTIEPLPRDGRSEWKQERELRLVLQQEERRDRFDPLAGLPGGYGDIFGRRRRRADAVFVPGVEAIEYRIESFDEEKATIAKTLKLVAGNDQANQKIAIKVEGKGTLTFDRKRGVMSAFKYEGEFSSTHGTDTSTFPVTLTYEPEDSAPNAVAATGSSTTTPAKPEPPKPDPKIQEQLTALAAAQTDNARQLEILTSLASVTRDAPSRAAVVDAVFSLIQSSDAALRIQAIKTLTHWDQATKVDDVARLLKHDDLATRKEAATYLGDMQDAAAAPALLERLSVAEDRDHVVAALQAIGPAVELEVAKSLKSKDEATRVAVCQVLGVVGGETSVAGLRILARKQTPDGQAAKDALTAMGRSVDAPKATPVVAATDEENPFEGSDGSQPKAKAEAKPAEEETNPFETTPPAPKASTKKTKSKTKSPATSEKKKSAPKTEPSKPEPSQTDPPQTEDDDSPFKPVDGSATESK